MVSWGSAFGRGVILWLWSIVWGIIGMVIGLAVGIGMSGGTLYEALMNPETIGREHIVPVFVGSLVAMVVIALGLWTALARVVTEDTRKA